MEVLDRQRAFFHSGQTRPLKHRLDGLKQLEQAIHNHRGKIEQALYLDLGKPSLESSLSEIHFLLTEIRQARKHLKSWMKPQRVGTPLLLRPASSYVLPCPRGVVLIIAPWNYPLRLSLCPLVGALAAGNCALIKLSPRAPHTARVIEQLISQNFSPDWVRVLSSDTKEVAQILEHPLGHVFFTGGPTVGRLIAEAAARKLTPITLELGGKNPAIIHRDADLKVTARRLIWGKFFNNAQTCVAPNYAFIHRSIFQVFLKEIKQLLSSWSQVYCWGKVVDIAHWDRLQKLLQGEHQILWGGKGSREQLLMEPTLVLNPPEDGPLMQEEIFGPILPVIEYEHISELLSSLSTAPPSLAAYIFTRDSSLQEQFIRDVPCGSICVNDSIVQANNHHLPFGGVGQSGHGCYYGKYSFLTFSHLKAVMKRPFFLDLSLRYPPYTTKKKKWLSLIK